MNRVWWVASSLAICFWGAGVWTQNLALVLIGAGLLIAVKVAS